MRPYAMCALYLALREFQRPSHEWIFVGRLQACVDYWLYVLYAADSIDLMRYCIPSVRPSVRLSVTDMLWLKGKSSERIISHVS